MPPGVTQHSVTFTIFLDKSCNGASVLIVPSDFGKDNLLFQNSEIIDCPGWSDEGWPAGRLAKIRPTYFQQYQSIFITINPEATLSDQHIWHELVRRKMEKIVGSGGWIGRGRKRSRDAGGMGRRGEAEEG